MAATAAPKLRLVYYAARGRAEAIRMAFAYAGVAFEDSRFGDDEIVAARDSGVLQPPFGQFPYLEVDGSALGQSGTILRYAAGFSDLLPGAAGSLERARCEAAIDQVNDVMGAIYRVFYYAPEEQKASATAELVSSKLPKLLAGLVNQLEASGSPSSPSPFLCGPAISAADIIYCSIAEAAPKMLAGVQLHDVEGAAPLKRVLEGVKAHPRLQTYFNETRPKVEADTRSEDY